MRLLNIGQEPEKKRTGGDNTALKHLHTLYLRDNLKVHTSGVVMVRTTGGFYDGFSISVPQSFQHAVTFAFHSKLNRAKKSQLVKFLSRYFYITAVNTVVDQVASACLQCLATVKIPKALIPDTTSIPRVTLSAG